MNVIFRRWMYRGQHPNWLAQLLNNIAQVLHSSGIAPDYMVTLEVTGRKSGKIISLPVVMTLVDEQRYLVSMLGDNVQWVKNLRAGGRAFIRSGKRTEVKFEEVPVELRAPILKAYLQHAPGARAHIPVDKDAALTEFEAVAASLPVFRIVPGGAA